MSDSRPSDEDAQAQLKLVAATIDDGGAEDEFAGIEPYRPKRSPILAVAVVLLSGYLLYHLRADLAYALRSRTPEEIADVRAFFATPEGIRNHSYVTVHAVPDRSCAVMLDAKGLDEFIPFVRVMGTDSHLLLAQRRGVRPVGDVYEDRYSGRLMRLSDVSYAPTVRSYFAKKTAATRFFRPEVVRPLVGQATARLPDLAGDQVTLQADSLVEVDVHYRHDYDVTLPRDRFPTENDARSFLDQVAVPAREPHETEWAFKFIVTIEPARRDRVINEMKGFDPRITIGLCRRRYQQPWSALANDGDELVLRGEATTRVPWGSITSVKTMGSLKIPATSFLLVEGERPQDLWYVPVFAVLFLLFIIWNALALVAAVRGRRRTETTSPS